MPDTVLIVHGDALVRDALAKALAGKGYCIVEAPTGRAGIDRAREGIDLAIIDCHLPDVDGLRVLEALTRQQPDALSIIATPHTDVQTAVQAIKMGAFQVVSQPFVPHALAAMVGPAIETGRLRREVRHLRAHASESFGIDSIIGASAMMRDLRSRIARVGVSPVSTVLITGESGTGKDLAAKVLHYSSRRSTHPFVNITCSALPDHLLESELFGHERGAFTDAREQYFGLLEQARGGTVFLNEIGEMPPIMQAKLLRFLEEKTYRRVGGLSDVHVDVRVVAATNRDLAEEVNAGRFRADLFYRLNVLPLSLPPLRAHPEDITPLLAFYIEYFNQEFRKTVQGVSGDAAQLLTGYRWPGNVRELRNAVERAMLLTAHDTLARDDFPFPQSSLKAQYVDLPGTGLRLDKLEETFVRQALERTNWNRTRAGKLLGMSRSQVQSRMDRLAMAVPQFVNRADAELE